MDSTINVRFWAKVDKAAGHGPNGDCWQWRGDKHGFGYGVVRCDGKRQLAHRVSMLMVHGALPEGKVVMHACDNPGCVNPAHLSFGSAGDNTRDMLRKGRHWQQGLTHCQRGHEFTPENTYTRPDGHRKCKACVKLMDRVSENARRKAKRQQAQLAIQ